VPRLNAIRDRTLDVKEPGVPERLARLKPDQLKLTADPLTAVLESRMTFIIVPTPSNPLGGFSLRYVLQAVEQIGAAIQRKRGPHTVALISTVLPGSCQRTVIPRLESSAHRTLGPDLGFVYNPVFIALGDIVNGFELPDYLLLGESDAAAGELVLSVHRTMVRNNAPVARMKPVEAEITKVASNTHETMRVSFANMLFCACSEIPGADVDRITEALSHRMGKRFFKGAVPYGGPCWPRDNKALSAFLDLIGTPSTMPKSVDTFNGEHALYLLRKVLEFTSIDDTVGIMGLSYKPGTPNIDRSFGVDLAVWLAQEGRKVVAWDPLAMDEAKRVTGNQVSYVTTPEELLSASRLAVLVNPIKDHKTINWESAATTTVVDCWRCLPTQVQDTVGHYRALGRGPSQDIHSWLAGYIGDHLRVLTE